MPSKVVIIVVKDQNGNVITVGLAVYDSDGVYIGTTDTTDGTLNIRGLTPPFTIVVNPSGHPAHPPKPGYQTDVTVEIQSSQQSVTVPTA